MTAQIGTDSLIKKARLLAGLRKRATPGPWEANLLGDLRADRVDILYSAGRHRMTVRAPGPPMASQAQGDIMLASKAPEMAELLGVMAEQMAMMVSWAESMCHATCSATLRRHGRHAPNCPIDDWQLMPAGEAGTCGKP